MFGFLNILKPPGPTSHDVVARIRRLVPRGTKVGHAGTLDPFASGVLVVCVGPATRLASYVQDTAKRYRATVRLGARSNTDDPEGEIAPAPGPIDPPTRQRVEECLRQFVGQIRQVPPAHSAVHVEGQRAYKLARKGKPVELPPRTVTVHAIMLIEYDWPDVGIEVHCASGTYIRSIARDLGEALGVGGYCHALERTAVGEFAIERAVALEDADPARDLLAPAMAVSHLPAVTLDADSARRLVMGQIVPLPPGEAIGSRESEEVAVLGAAGELLAIARLAGPDLRPLRVFQ